MYLHANRPEQNAEQNAIVKPFNCVISNNMFDEKIYTNSNNIIPIMGNKTIINENSAAFFLLTPQNNAIAMVAPDRDIPGNMANAWAKPIKKAS